MLSILGEPIDSILILRLKSMFSIADISHFLLDGEPSEIDPKSGDERSLLLKHCTQELSELIECLYWTLPTLEMVFQTVLARQTQNPALDERAMLLLKSESDISLSNMRSAPTKELLQVDLELIAAMRESLKDTKYVKYMEHKEPAIDPEQLYKQLGEESAQVKYWTSKLAEEKDEKDGMTEETQAAMMLNLARIARVFGVYTDYICSQNYANIYSFLYSCGLQTPLQLETNAAGYGRNPGDDSPIPVIHFR